MTDRPPDASNVEAPNIDAMLRSARDALAALHNEHPGPPRPGPLVKATIVIVWLLAMAALYVHTFREKDSPKVDTTSVALLAVILVAPFVPRLRAVELGGAKAQWQEDATTSISQVLAVIELQHRALEQLYLDGIADVRPPADEAPDLNVTPARTDGPVLRPLRHILWVDDHPANNAYEVEALRTTARVTLATTTQRALEILRTEDIDAVISDISRSEGGRDVHDAGVRLMREVQELPPSRRVPIFFYSGSSAVERYGGELEALGAAVVTTSHRELFQALRRHQIQAATEIVREIVRQFRGATLLDVPDSGIDCVIGLDNGRRIGLEVASWVTRPQMSAFADRTGRLVSARGNGLIDEGWLLVRDEVIDERRRAYADTQGIRLVSLATARDSLEAAAAAV